MELVLVEHNKTYSNLTITLVQTYDISISPRNENLNLLVQIKFLNLFLYTGTVEPV
jgi:hypothetical protein